MDVVEGGLVLIEHVAHGLVDLLAVAALFADAVLCLLHLRHALGLGLGQGLLEGEALDLEGLPVPEVGVGLGEAVRPVGAVLGLVGDVEVVRVRELDERLPLLIERERLEQAAAAVVGAAVVQGVVVRVARQLDHVLRQRDGLLDAGVVAQAAGEPLVVVGEVVDLIGEDPVTHHVGVVDAGRGLLLPGGVGVAA